MRTGPDAQARPLRPRASSVPLKPAVRIRVISDGRFGLCPTASRRWLTIFERCSSTSRLDWKRPRGFHAGPPCAPSTQQVILPELRVRSPGRRAAAWRRRTPAAGDVLGEIAAAALAQGCKQLATPRSDMLLHGHDRLWGERRTYDPPQHAGRAGPARPTSQAHRSHVFRLCHLRARSIAARG